LETDNVKLATDNIMEIEGLVLRTAKGKNEAVPFPNGLTQLEVKEARGVGDGGEIGEVAGGNDGTCDRKLLLGVGIADKDGTSERDRLLPTPMYERKKADKRNTETDGNPDLEFAGPGHVRRFSYRPVY
jgi:hypothetical protein